ncbi:CMRF35-like molecule 1 isoform X3 [Tamandua tetradactyla]|uniref:CMRF35-like molecule 1 isoform X3 n=1 Tax=Tamandua tetradactyla TaxID=48850 RepID=UPI004053F68D
MYLLLLPFLLGLSGGFPIHGPKKKSGPERGSVTLQCHYDPGWETYRKWWCRGADWDTCKILIKTTGSEQEVKEHHISIRDNQEKRVFTVTMTDVSKKDADTYWCGIERIGSDLGFQVEVTIDSAPTTMWTTASNANMFTEPAASEETTSSSTLTSPRSSGRHGIWDLSILLPLIIAVFLLLLVAASLLIWRILKQQKKAAGISSEQVLQPLEGELCYANLTLQQTRPSKGSSRMKASVKSASALAGQVEVEYVTMASFPKEDISYAALSLDALEQDPTYSNTDGLIARVPTRPPAEPTEYSAIRKE